MQHNPPSQLLQASTGQLAAVNAVVVQDDVDASGVLVLADQAPKQFAEKRAVFPLVVYPGELPRLAFNAPAK